MANFVFMSDEFIAIGYFPRIHGFKGNLQFKGTADFPISYLDLEAMYVEMPMGVVPFKIEHITHKRNNEYIVKLLGINTDLDAKNMSGKGVVLSRELIPSNNSSEDFYHHEIEGFKVFNYANLIGLVIAVMDVPGNPLLEIRSNSDEEDILIPLQDDFIVKIDKKGKEIHLELPEGILDLNA